MASNNIENEIKLYVPDHEPVKRKLETAGASLKAARVFERNVRYDTPDQALRPRGGVLRLRQDTRVRLTYKDGDRVVGELGTSRFEAEVEVNDFDTMQTILGKLGYRPFMGYEKYRTTYELDEAEITLDEMPYGNFVEIEGEDTAIGPVMEKLDLKQAPRFHASYVVLFELVKQHLNLRFTDLSFENFKGITVPLSAFAQD